MKLTDRLQYFHYSLVHPELNKRSLIYCQTLILKKSCLPLKEILKKSYQKRNHGFLKNRTKNRLFAGKLKKTKSFCENKKKSEINKKKGIPFCCYLPPKLKGLSKIIKDNLCVSYMNDEVRKTFTVSPMISSINVRY